jgi:hypothetical protein
MIPSSAFLKIGQNLIAPEIIRATSTSNRKRIPEQKHREVSANDILREWASIVVDYFGEYIHFT